MVRFVVLPTVQSMFNNRLVQEYRGIQAGWHTVAIRPAAEAEALVAKLQRIKPQLIHRAW